MNDIYALEKLSSLMVRHDPTGYIEDFEVISEPFKSRFRLFDKRVVEFDDYHSAIDFCMEAISSNIDVALQIEDGK